MCRYWMYLKYVIRHKWFVLLEGIRLGVPIWMLIIHDWDKFTPFMMWSYARTFRTSDGKSQYQPNEAFRMACLYHYRRNKHHWQWWVMHWEDGSVRPMPIPDIYRRELLADWRGTGRAKGVPDTRSWYLKQRAMFAECLHPLTRYWIESQLEIEPDSDVATAG